jgi:hypothetical protein
MIAVTVLMMHIGEVKIAMRQDDVSVAVSVRSIVFPREAVFSW